MTDNPVFDKMIERIVTLRKAEYLYSNDPIEHKNLCALLNFAGGEYDPEKHPSLNFFQTYITIARDIDYIKLEESKSNKAAPVRSPQLSLY